MKKAFSIYRRRQDGVVAIEFAFLALPFFILVIGLIEISMFFASAVVLEGGMNVAARQIRTGQVQLSDDPEATFRTLLCDHVETILDCDNMQYEVIRIDPNNFAGAEANEPEFDEDGNFVPRPFSTGNSNDVVLMRAVYRYEFFTPYLGAMMTGDPDIDWVSHMSTTVVKAEPYIFGEE